MAELISIVVTTYDRIDALDAVLRSLSLQADRDFEVVIADDGSGPETAALINAWKARLGVPLKHVWHEHRDFRAGEIRNRGVRASAISRTTPVMVTRQMIAATTLILASST